MSIGTMLFNPFTGKPRDPRDIASDPRGILVWDGEEPLRAATPQKAEATQAPIWTRCVFEGSPPAGYASWHEWLASPVKSWVTIKATYGEATQAAAEQGRPTERDCLLAECLAVNELPFELRQKIKAAFTPPSPAQSPEHTRACDSSQRDNGDDNCICGADRVPALAEPMSDERIVEMWSRMPKHHSIVQFARAILAEAGIKEKP